MSRTGQSSFSLNKERLMQTEELQRYSRQMILPEIGEVGQQALHDAHVLIMGLGGLGSPAALYLAAAGVGTLSLADFDRVNLSNLHRQILYDDTCLGQKKTNATATRLRAINPVVQLHRLEQKLTDHELLDLMDRIDLVLDCTDNFASRHAINRACVRSRTPLLMGAAIRFDGQIALFNNNATSPCYACLYPSADETTERCSEQGILGPVAGVIGSLQALEAIKWLADLDRSLDGRLLLLDATSLQWRSVGLRKDPKCAVCH